MSDSIHSPLEQDLPHAGRLVQYHGALLPACYSNSLAEYQAVRDSAGVFDLSFRSQFTARGSDRVRFLQGMVTNDVKLLRSGQGTYALLLNSRGHILADVTVYCAEDHFIIETDADLLDKALQALNHYNIGGRTPLEPLSVSGLAIQGPKARAVLKEVLGISVFDLASLNHTSTDWMGQAVRILQAGHTGEDGCEVWLDRNGLKPLWDALLERGRDQGLLPCGVNALETLRIEAGIPKYGSELAEDTLPLEADLLSALSLTKGCYLGQEIVERARSRGRVNWKMVGLFLESSEAPKAGDRLRSGDRDVGEITSACPSPALGRTIAMGYVRREVSDLGTKLTLSSGAGAEVTALPFYARRQ
ncbi:MAG TPA: aminomethyltransferase family protein [Terriglobia bacterium]|nr:aminomethyltransferase family protein [Terriglobia bacterium]